MNRIVLILTLILFPQITFASDMRIVNNMSTMLDATKQYYVRVSCKPTLTIDRYMKRLGIDGRLARNAKFGGGVKKVSHFLVFTNEYKSSLDKGFVNPAEAGKLSDAIFIYVFAKDTSSNNNSVIRTGNSCSTSFFLKGTSKYSLLPVLAVSKSSAATDIAAATLAFGRISLSNASEIFRNKPIGESQNNDLERGNAILVAYKEFKAALSGKFYEEEPINLGKGSLIISTGASQVTITVTEHESYLLAPNFVPFLANRRAFADLEKDNEGKLILASKELKDDEIIDFQKACRAQNEKYIDIGFTSAADRAFLLSLALEKHNPDLINVVRCFVETNLAEAFLDPKVNKWIQNKINILRFGRPDLNKYRLEYDPETRQKVIEEIRRGNAEITKDQESSINQFLSYYGQLLNPGTKNISELALAKMGEVSSSALTFQDSANLLGGVSSTTGAVSTLRMLSTLGFNRLNCFFQKTENNVNKLGGDTFGAAPFVMLMHRADPVTFVNKEAKILSPENAIVLRGYFDKDTGQISLLETSSAPATPLFENHSRCKRLMASKS